MKVDWWYPFFGGVLFGCFMSGTTYILANLYSSPPVKTEDEWLREFFLASSPPPDEVEEEEVT